MQTKIFKGYAFAVKVSGEEFAVIAKDEKAAEIAFSHITPHI